MATICGSYTYIPVAHIQAGERSGNIDGVATCYWEIGSFTFRGK